MRIAIEIKGNIIENNEKLETKMRIVRNYMLEDIIIIMSPD